MIRRKEFTCTNCDQPCDANFQGTLSTRENERQGIMVSTCCEAVAE